MQSFNQGPTRMFSPGTSRVGSRPRFMPVTLMAWRRQRITTSW